MNKTSSFRVCSSFIQSKTTCSLHIFWFSHLKWNEFCGVKGLPSLLKRCTRSCRSGDTVHREDALVHRACRPKPSEGRHRWQTPGDDRLLSSNQSSPATMTPNFHWYQSISFCISIPCSFDGYTVILILIIIPISLLLLVDGYSLQFYL